jgi:hypothetical protein
MPRARRGDGQTEVAFALSAFIRVNPRLGCLFHLTERFSWGREGLRDAGAMRKRYIAALQAADNHDIGPLLVFARS